MKPRGQQQWREAGKAARKRVPRSSLAQWQPSPQRRDPIQILIDQGDSRLPQLLPLRYERMLVSPFTFYRGAAAIMAADLGSKSMPQTGLIAQLAGDAHLANFGGYASPERDFVFDVNDFDETLPGPFEWDLKRLVASFAVAGRSQKFSTSQRRSMLVGITAAYREAMAEFATQTRLEVWYAHLDTAAILAKWAPGASEKRQSRFLAVVQKGQRKTSQRALDQMTEVVAGQLRFKSEPPILVPISDILDPDQVGQFGAASKAGFDGYRRSLNNDIETLFNGYEFKTAAHKVVGVGSVGTRCWVTLFTVEGDDADPLVLQLKQAEASVLEPYAGRSRTSSHGQRVVFGQRLMQASSDIFLGWTSVTGLDGLKRDFYVRQLWDWKQSADLDNMDLATYGIYGQMCGWTLARAHARSGQRVELASYLGTSDTADRALADFAEAYADQNEADYEQMQQALADGRITTMVDPKAT